MGLRRIFNEWREKADGTLTGPALDAGTAETDNQTLVRFERDNSTSTIPAGTYQNLYDTLSVITGNDPRNEASGSSFTPDKSGWCRVNFGADIRGNTNAGDKLVFRLRENGNVIGPVNNLYAPDSASLVNMPLIYNLDAGKTYEMVVTNKDSSFTVENSANTTGVIMRTVVQYD